MGFKKGYTPWNKGKTGLYNHSDEAKQKISNARKKGSSWSKGQHLSEEHRENISNALKGKKKSETHKENCSLAHIGLQAGEKHPLFGTNRSEETKRKIGAANSIKLKGRKLSKKSKEKIRIANTGDKAPNWKGGTSFTPYCHKFNRALKEKIRDRDNRICQICGAKEGKEKHSVHHVNSDEKNCDPLLISLCRSCHMKTHQNKDYYIPLLIKNLKDRGLLIDSQGEGASD